VVVLVLDDDDEDEDEEDDDDELVAPPTLELPDGDALTSVGWPMTVFFGRALVTTTGFSLAHVTNASCWVLAAAASAAAFCRALTALLRAVSWAAAAVATPVPATVAAASVPLSTVSTRRDRSR